MRTIWKFPLPLHCENAPVNTLRVPASFRPLSVDLQRGVPVIWAEVDVPQRVLDKDPDLGPDYEHWDKCVFVTRCATGKPMPPDPGTYIGTYQYLDQTCNKHVYIKWEDGTPVVRA